MLSFKPALSLSSFTLNKKLFSSSSLSANRVVSSGYLRLLISLTAILISACDSFSLAVPMMNSTYKLNEQGGNIQPSRIPFQFWTSQLFMSSSNCCFLTCLQVSQEAGKVLWYSPLFKNFPQFIVIHIVKGFSRVNEADVFLEFSGLLYDSTNVGNLISGFSDFFKPSLYILEVLNSLIAEA